MSVLLACQCKYICPMQCRTSLRPADFLFTSENTDPTTISCIVTITTASSIDLVLLLVYVTAPT